MQFIRTELVLTHAPYDRFPVLLAIDDFQALYCQSLYRDPYFKAVESYHLTLPRTLLEFASGKQSFVRGATPVFSCS